MMNAKRSSKYNLTRYAFLVPAVVALLLVFSISKAAFVKKTVPAIKTFSTVSSKAAEKGMVTITATVNKASTPVIEMLKATFVSPRINTGVTDTIRKGGFFLSTSGKSDSLNYVINGVKSTKADLMKLNEKNIESVNIMSGDWASKLVDNLDKSQNTIFVYTRDSEAGRKFKERADKILDNNYAASGLSRHTNGRGSYTIATGVSSGSGYSYSGDDDNAVVVVGTQGKPAKVQAYNFSTTGGNSQVITVQGRPAATYRLNPSKVYLRYKNDTSLTLKGSANMTLFDDSARIRTLNSKLHGTVMSYTVKPGAERSVWLSEQNEKFSLDHIADKLIIINGNIASQSDLKKISAFDIDKVVVKNDEETKELYGDKAKKGIVFIVTKKK